MHELRINTRERVLTLDGIDIADSTVECIVRYRGKETPMVTLKLLADVDLRDLVSIEKERFNESSQ